MASCDASGVGRQVRVEITAHYKRAPAAARLPTLQNCREACQGAPVKLLVAFSLASFAARRQ
eukprot:741523-Lingulodinium_polyedra.AAC.1